MTNIWSSAQGSSDSYGSANGFGTSSSGAMATAGAHALPSLATGQMQTVGAGQFSGAGGGITSALTTSYAGAATSGSGYVQVQNLRLCRRQLYRRRRPRH